MSENIVSETKQKIEDWIGYFDGLYTLPDDKAERLLSFIEEKDVDMENASDVEWIATIVKCL